MFSIKMFFLRNTHFNMHFQSPHFQIESEALSIELYGHFSAVLFLQTQYGANGNPNFCLSELY